MANVIGKPTPRFVNEGDWLQGYIHQLDRNDLIRIIERVYSDLGFDAIHDDFEFEMQGGFYESTEVCVYCREPFKIDEDMYEAQGQTPVHRLCARDIEKDIPKDTI